MATIYFERIFKNYTHMVVHHVMRGWFQLVVRCCAGLPHGFAAVGQVHGRSDGVAQIGAANVGVGHGAIHVPHRRCQRGIVQQHAPGGVGAVPHAVGMGVAVVVQGMMVAEGVRHAAGVRGRRKAQ